MGRVKLEWHKQTTPQSANSRRVGNFHHRLWWLWLLFFLGYKTGKYGGLFFLTLQDITLLTIIHYFLQYIILVWTTYPQYYYILQITLGYFQLKYNSIFTLNVNLPTVSNWFMTHLHSQISPLVLWFCILELIRNGIKNWKLKCFKQKFCLTHWSER